MVVIKNGSRWASPILHNLMWLTHSSCDAPPRHSYFGQIQNTVTSRKNKHLSSSFTDVKCCESHSLNRTGCVVCCRYAWRQWSSFIHDADYLTILTLSAFSLVTWPHEGLWLAVMTRDTQLPWYDSLRHDQKRISSRNAVNINITLLLM